MALKGDYLIATLLYGEVFTVWEDTLGVFTGSLEGQDVCMGREKTSPQRHGGRKGKGLTERTASTPEGESGNTLGICSKGSIK